MMLDKTGMIKIIVITIFMVFWIFCGKAYAGQTQIQEQSETKTSLTVKLNQCVQSNATQTANFLNLQVTNGGLLVDLNNSKSTLLDLQKKFDIDESTLVDLRAENDKLKTENENLRKDLDLRHKHAKYILGLLILTALLFLLSYFFRSRANYFVAARNLRSGRIAGITSLIFLGLAAITGVFFFYFLIRLIF